MFFEDVDNCYESSRKSKVEHKEVSPQMLAPSNKEKFGTQEPVVTTKIHNKESILPLKRLYTGRKLNLTEQQMQEGAQLLDQMAIDAKNEVNKQSDSSFKPN